MSKQTGDENAPEVSKRRRFLQEVGRKARRGASTGPAVALLLGATTKSALASGGGCGCGCGAGLPNAGDSVDGIDAHFTLPGGSFEDELSSGDTWDWFTFSASAGNEVSLTLEGIPGSSTGFSLAEPEIALYWDMGDGVPEVGDAVGFDLSLLASGDGSITDFLIPADGTYIAAIAEGNGGEASSNEGGYRATVSIVPEPSTGTLLGGALAGFAWLRRRLRK